MPIIVIVSIIAVGIAISFIFIGHALERKKANQYFNNQEQEIDFEKLEIQKENAKDFEINKIQLECLFCQDYIIILTGEYKNKIFLSKNLKRVYHFIHTVNNTMVGTVKREKGYMLDFSNDVHYCFADKINEDEFKYNKKIENCNFDSSVLILLKQLYPWISINYNEKLDDKKEYSTNECDDNEE